MKKGKSMLQLKKSVISNLRGEVVIGGRVTTDWDTKQYCDDSSRSDPRDATQSHSNCGECTDW